MTITTEGSERYTMECKLENPRHIVVIHRGKEVGTVSAQYDFSNLPPAFHEIVVGMCYQTNTLHCNIPVTREDYLEEERRLQAQREYLARLNRSLWKIVVDWWRNLWKRSKS